MVVIPISQEDKQNVIDNINLTMKSLAEKLGCSHEQITSFLVGHSIGELVRLIGVHDALQIVLMVIEAIKQSDVTPDISIPIRKN